MILGVYLYTSIPLVKFVTSICRLAVISRKSVHNMISIKISNMMLVVQTRFQMVLTIQQISKCVRR